LVTTGDRGEARRALGARIRSARKAADLSLKELASRLGVRPGTVVSWESGQRQPGLTQVVAIADHCGADLVWLLTGRRPKRTALEEALARLTEDVAAVRSLLTRWVAEGSARYPQQPEGRGPDRLDPTALASEVSRRVVAQLPAESPDLLSALEAALASALRDALEHGPSPDSEG
jgi:transcriptional regulator with XRE-family HTH domain